MAPELSTFAGPLRYVITDNFYIAFMINIGQFPASIFIHSNRLNYELYSEPSFPAPQLYLSYLKGSPQYPNGDQCQ